LTYGRQTERKTLATKKMNCRMSGKEFIAAECLMCLGRTGGIGKNPWNSGKKQFAI